MNRYELSARVGPSEEPALDAPCWLCTYDRQNHGTYVDHNWTPVPLRARRLVPSPTPDQITEALLDFDPGGFIDEARIRRTRDLLGWRRKDDR